MDKHKVDHIMKLFMKHIGPVPNWDPETIQKKFLYTNRSKIWLAKQGIIKLTSDFNSVSNFERELKNGYNFIALVSTSNLDADSAENHTRLNDFFQEYNDPFIWVICRGVLNRNKPSNEHIEIIDLNFGPNKDRNNPLVLKVPMNDIFMTVLMEENDKVSIFANEEYFQLFNKGNKRLIKIKRECKGFFKTITPTNVARYQEPNTSTIDPSSEPSQADSRFDLTSQSEITSQSELSESSRPPVGLSTRFRPDYDIEFHEKYFIVKTPKRKQRFDEQSKKDHVNLIEFHWAKETPAERGRQWTEMKKRKFNLFQRVEDSEADSLVFIPAQQLLGKHNDLVTYWKQVTGDTYVPRNMFYVIYDKKDDIPFTSEYNNPNNIFE